MKIDSTYNEEFSDFLRVEKCTTQENTSKVGLI